MNRWAVLAAVAAITTGQVNPVHAETPADEWHDTAIAVGWPETMWPWVECVIMRESGGDPGAYNGRDPGYGSFGLMQLNMSRGRYGTWNVYAPILGYDITNLYDPKVNLAVGLDLFHRAQRMYRNGYKPWGRGCR